MKKMGGLIFFIGLSALWAAEVELESSAKDKVTSVYAQLVQSHFPKLRAINPEIYQLNSDFNFFETDIQAFYKSPLKRRYILRVSPKVFAADLSDAGFKAIMAHELQHFSDYVGMNLWQVIHLGVRYNYLRDLKWIARFERNTDRAVIQKGFAPGLIEFRQWLYRQLPPKAIAQKTQLYLTPDEMK